MTLSNQKLTTPIKPDKALEPSITQLSTAGILSGLTPDILTYSVFHKRTLDMTDANIRKLSYFSWAKNIVSTEGVCGLYKGMTPVLLGIPGTAIFFSSVHYSRNLYNRYKFPLADGAAGMSGQLCASAIWVPTSVISEGMQSTKKTLVEMVQHIHKTEGFIGFFRGFGPQLATYGVPNGIGLQTSGYIQQCLPIDYQNFSGAVFSHTLGFGLAGAITTPFDVVRTRLQVGASDRAKCPERTIVSSIKQTYTEHGFKGFFHGVHARSTWFGLRQGTAFPLCSLILNKLLASDTSTEQPVNAPTPKR